MTCNFATLLSHNVYSAVTEYVGENSALLQQL